MVTHIIPVGGIPGVPIQVKSSHIIDYLPKCTIFQDISEPDHTITLYNNTTQLDTFHYQLTTPKM